VERIISGRSATLTHTFYSARVATDPSPDSATVTITRADGTALVTAAAATEAGTGKVTYTVTPAQTALLDTWRVDWFATFGGQAQTFREYVEVAGGVLCTLHRTSRRCSRPPPTRSSADIRTDAEQALEDECGQAFVPRYARETLDGDGSVLVLTNPNVRAIRSASYTYGGVVTPLTTSQLGYLAFNPSGILTGYTWPCGTGNVTVAYEHGRDYAPPGARTAVLAAAQEIHGASTGDGRVIRREADGQAVTYASASSSGGFLDPALRAFVARNSLRTGIA
jgi:hypothetical protein